ISSSSGSADALEALGVKIDLTPEQGARLIEKVGISFLYAPNFHPIMLKVFGPEQQLGIKTIFFTIIGPLINPAGAPYHLMGVYRPELVPMVAEVVAQLGMKHVMVVHGLDGLDEISIIGRTSVAEIRDGKIEKYEIAPEDFGLGRATLDDVAGGSAAFNASVIRDVFDGKDRGPRRDFLVLNNAAALYVSGRVGSVAEGIGLARANIDSGAARAKLDELATASQAV
ncbi:MAG: anthranilate phosphoribosyltransferase, partial [Gemmataceae bacterium]|nr:anthranilate phosphoribosyltransferase [Gemmataceae bacterium]